MSKEIFISHAQLDSEIADSVVDLLQTGLDISSSKVFCSSLEGLGIPPGENFVSFIHKQIQEPKAIIPLVSKSYLESVFCLCELGAAWGFSHRCFPLVISPVDFSDLKAVLTGIQAARINDPQGLNTFADAIESALEIDKRNFARWEKKRNDFLNKLPALEESQPNRVSQNPVIMGVENAPIAIPSIRKQFSDRDVQQFLKDGYEYVYAYFRRSLSVSMEHHAELEFELKKPETNRFTCKTYLNGNYKCQCQVWVSEDLYGPAICYSDKISSEKNQINSSFSVEKTKQRLIFKSTFGILERKFKSADESQAEGIAEYLWEQFSEKLSY